MRRPYQLRTENFNALAVFAAAVPKDTNGRAQVRVKVPDNLTRYRVMASLSRALSSSATANRRSRRVNRVVPPQRRAS